MMRLYLRFYFALVASLFLFVLATATLWHFTGGSAEHSGITLEQTAAECVAGGRRAAD